MPAMPASDARQTATSLGGRLGLEGAGGALREGRPAMTTCYEHIRPEHATDPLFLGYALADYMAHTGMSEASLLRWLNVHPDDLAALACRRNPDPASVSFRADCQALAARFGLNADRLATMLRELAWEDAGAPIRGR